MHTNLSRIIVLSTLALGMGFAAPADAKNSRHPATSAYASAERDNGARAGQVRADRWPEPAYMAIQSKRLSDGD
jgi:hypothetical protein